MHFGDEIPGVCRDSRGVSSAGNVSAEDSASTDGLESGTLGIVLSTISEHDDGKSTSISCVDAMVGSIRSSASNGSTHVQQWHREGVSHWGLCIFGVSMSVVGV